MRRGTKLICLIAVLTISASACGGGGGDDAAAGGDSGTVATTRPKPPPPTAVAGTAAPAPTSSELLNQLPKAADISKLQLGIPAVAAIRVLSVEVPQDTAGPCGAPIEPLTLEGAAGRSYDMVKGHIVGVVVPRDAAVDAYVDAVKADLTEGCPSHDTTIGGDDVTLSAPSPVDISATAPDGVAWISNVENPAGGGQRAVVMMPTDTLLSVVLMSSPETIDPALVQQMADIWYTKATT